MAYWNAAGLAATRAVEGGSGGYTAHDPNSSASGAYSFLTSTWQTYAPRVGVDITQYPYAYMAPPAVQDRVASITPVSNWGGSWAGSGGANAANPAFTQATPMTDAELASGGANFTPPAGTPDTFVVSTTPGSQSEYPLNPGDYSSDPNASFTFNDPSTGGAGTSSTTSAGGTNAQGVAAQSGQGQPVQLNLSPSTASDLQSYVTAPITAAENWASAQLASLSNWFTRGFLILLAIVIILVALWKATGSPNVTEIAKAA